MAEELELKAVIFDPGSLRQRLLAAGAVAGFQGRMSDRRFDREGELAARDEVLRVRNYHLPGGQLQSVLGWKGPARRSAGGYKQRQEIELAAATGSSSPEELLAALGYRVVHAIDRDVEVYQLGGATVRLERYPRMDPLLEIEGEPEAIEHAILISAIPRSSFSADSLTDFVRRFEARSGRTAVLALEGG